MHISTLYIYQHSKQMFHYSVYVYLEEEEEEDEEEDEVGEKVEERGVGWGVFEEDDEKK